MNTVAAVSWGLCRLAYDASEDAHFPGPMRRLFGMSGHYWFWTASAFQGDAYKMWLELCNELTRRQFEPVGA
jgi:hypothetical protein